MITQKEDCKLRAMGLEATYLRDGRWAVRPEGQLGTMGWSPRPWTVVYVKANNAVKAIALAAKWFA